jgi:NarL family two-component system response regulator LiaR
MKVLLIDDHPLVSFGFGSILDSTGLFSVRVQAKSLAEARIAIEGAAPLPQLIILDILLGEENGLDFLPVLDKFCKAKKNQKPPVLVYSALEDSFQAETARELGASGYVPKTAGKAELLKAIDAILGGEFYFPSSDSEGQNSAVSSLYEKFTKREMQVINLVRQKRSNQEIAHNLGLNLRTVENYLSNIYFKTGCENREALLKL